MDKSRRDFVRGTGLVGLGMIASGPFSSRAWAAGEPIALGWVGPLSPPGNYSGGQEMKWAVQQKADEINKAGGILGRPVEVFYEDTKGQPAEGSAAAVRLITQNHVAALFGEFHSSVALAEIDVAHKYGVPWIGTDVWADQITALHYPEVFRVSPANSLIYLKVANWIADRGFKHVAIVAENSDFGQGGAKVVADIYKQRGVDHSVVTIELNQQDFTPALLRLMNASPRPDLLEMVVAGQAQYQIVKQACQLGFAPTAKTAMIGSSGLLQKEVWEVDGQCAKDLLVVDVAMPKAHWNDQARAFVENFQKRYGRAPTGVAMEAYDTLGVLAAGIAKAGSTDGKAIIHALESIHYTGVHGSYSFSDKTEPAWAYHQWMDVPFMVIQYTEMNQTPEAAAILFPKDWATTDKIQPEK
ncbi:MAG TPA: ABC transporter substrate-binding protein [Acetobacteraceae bacterium]|nr:ABC transporter substrate-binding protein [Acetobacteraceae bacterium]